MVSLNFELVYAEFKVRGRRHALCKGLVRRHSVSVQVSCNRCLLRSASGLSVGSNPLQSTCSLLAINGYAGNKLRLRPKRNKVMGQSNANTKAWKNWLYIAKLLSAFFHKQSK